MPRTADASEPSRSGVEQSHIVVVEQSHIVVVEQSHIVVVEQSHIVVVAEFLRKSVLAAF